MVVKDINIPVVPLPGSEGWADAYKYGNLLERKFPGQQAESLCYAIEHNEAGPAAKQEIVNLVMEQEGGPDEQDWIWRVTFEDGTTWRAIGWCDYTGWDCQSGLAWEQI